MWKVISNSLNIDFIYGDIHGRSCKYVFVPNNDGKMQILIFAWQTFRDVLYIKCCTMTMFKYADFFAYTRTFVPSVKGFSYKNSIKLYSLVSNFEVWDMH